MINHNLYIEQIDTYIDPYKPVKNAIITHSHFDHAKPGHENVLATRETIDIMKIRYGANCARNFQVVKYNEEIVINNVRIKFIPAGHILGSSQILISNKKNKILITGDFKTINDKSCVCFEESKCDLLITEATFGLPIFKHPDPITEIKKLTNQIIKKDNKTFLVGAYSLGKSQRLISLLREIGYDETVYIHGSLKKICDYYVKNGIFLGSYDHVKNKKEKDLINKIIIAPPSSIKSLWSNRFINKKLCLASGWMTIKQRIKQNQIEIPLIISDHSDWYELTNNILNSQARNVWVTHGREDALTYWCKENSINSKPLRLVNREEGN